MTFAIGKSVFIDLATAAATNSEKKPALLRCGSRRMANEGA